MKNKYYINHMGDLRQRLMKAVPQEDIKALHQKSAIRHLTVVGRQLLLMALCIWALWQTEIWYLWIPAAILQGFNILGFIILLHEQVHGAIFMKRHPKIERFLGLFYAFPSAISATQFGIWHMDHHRELGSSTDDPKRAHLSPKVNKRWFKFLYCTPALFVIYAKAAAREAKTYDKETQKTINRERLFNALGHLTIIGALLYFGGGWVLLRVYVIPFFFCFPPAFMLNRLGQHYDIDPSDPAKWSTLVNGNRAWHFLFLWSNFHIEHHYFQNVPFYNLKKLNKDLQPFFQETGIKNRTYREIIYGWFVKNKAPHTNWEEDDMLVG